MQVEEAIDHTFDQLLQVLEDLNNTEYSAGPDILNGSGIGQHCRHLLEMFTCLHQGYESGVVNYEKRERNKSLEQYRSEAINQINLLRGSMTKPEKEMILEASYGLNTGENETYKTSYKRELAYAFEHAIHHMALIGVGLKVVAPHVKPPENFGVATSTIKYRQACAR